MFTVDDKISPADAQEITTLRNRLLEACGGHPPGNVAMALVWALASVLAKRSISDDEIDATADFLRQTIEFLRQQQGTQGSALPS
jgi:hypothetical protein